MHLYVRRRVGPSAFLEIFLACNESGHLDLPVDPVARFEGRILKAYELSGQIRLCAVSSAAPQSIQKRTAADIQKDGFWAVYHDSVPKGGPIGPSVAVVFGIPVAVRVHTMLYHGIVEAYKAVQDIWPDVSVEHDPWATYHGTAKSSMASIMKEGLKPSFGMLGHAVYLGTFWKAFRFATLTQDYQKRPGAIIRILCFWTKKLGYRTRLNDPCRCIKCGSRGSPLADHDGLWHKIFGHVAVWAIPYVGGPIKNEEYACIDTRTLLMDSVGYAAATTEHHEPFNRDYCIL